MNDVISKGTIFVKGEEGNIIVAPSAIERIHDIEVQKKALDKEYKKFKAALLEGMEEYGLKQVDTEELLVTYVEPSERLDIDRERLWAEHKDIAFECQKFTPVKASVRIKVR